MEFHAAGELGAPTKISRHIWVYNKCARYPLSETCSRKSGPKFTKIP